MVVRQEAFPKRSDLVIGESDIAGRDRPMRETAEDDVFGIASEFGTDARKIDFAVIDGRLFVTPPSDGIGLSSCFNIRQANPDKTSAAADAVT